MITAEFDTGRRAGLKFDSFPVAAHDALLERITALTGQLEARVLARVPSASGKLREMVQSFVDDKGTKISGKVKVISGSNKSDHGKAAALEYGAHGRFQVQAYQRVVSNVFGRAVAPTTQFIAAYGRTANITEQRFLRGPLAEMRAQIVAELRAAIAEASSRV